jgi:hypothetical protein
MTGKGIIVFRPNRGWKLFRKCVAIFLFTLILAACNLPRSTPTSEPAQGNPQNCYFNWATQPLPDLSAKVQAALNATGLKGVLAIAEAFGENCHDPETNKPIRFATLETDFRITVTVTNLGDKDNLGNSLDKILGVLDDFTVGDIPGTQAGYIFVSFQSGSENLNMSFTVAAGKSARAAGLHGSALLQELQDK